MEVKVTVLRIDGDTVSIVMGYELAEFIENLIQVESHRISKIVIEAS